MFEISLKEFRYFKGNPISLKKKIDELQTSWEEITFEVKEFYFIWCDNIKNSRLKNIKKKLIDFK